MSQAQKSSLSHSGPAERRPAIAKPGCRNPTLDKSAGQPRGPSLRTNADPERLRRFASKEAAAMEQDSIRHALKAMAQRSMSPAELGMELANILSRSPSLLADGEGVADPTDVGGVPGVDASRYRELLPLPTPPWKPSRDNDRAKCFDS